MEPVAMIANRVGQSLRRSENTDDRQTMNSTDEVCDKCDGSGWLTISSGMAPCSCQIERTIQRGLPKRYRSARLAHFSDALQQVARQWIEDPIDGLLLFGEPGSGKTYLAAALHRALVERGSRCAFRRLADLYRDLRECFQKSNASETEIIAPYLQTTFLVLDDLGSGALTDLERRSALEIVDVRLNSLRPTIVTTNLDVDEISAKIDCRLASRLCSYVTMRVAGADRRLEKAIPIAHPAAGVGSHHDLLAAG